MSARRVPFPEDLLREKPQLQKEHDALSAEDREQVRQRALKSNRYLLHEYSLWRSS